MESKKPYTSKTIIVNLLVAVGAMVYPPMSEYISQHPAEVATLFSILNIVLRLVTKDRISIRE